MPSEVLAHRADTIYDTLFEVAVAEGSSYLSADRLPAFWPYTSMRTAAGEDLHAPDRQQEIHWPLLAGRSGR